MEMSISILLSYKREALLTYSLHSISASVASPVVWPTVAFSFVEIQRLKYLGAHLLYMLTLILGT